MLSTTAKNAPLSPLAVGLRVGPCGTIFFQDRPLLLPPKESGVLTLLLNDWPRVVSKERFSTLVWSGGMSDAGLARSITQLRHALASVDNLAIRSAYGRGYQLVLGASSGTGQVAVDTPRYTRLIDAAMAPAGMAESLIHARQLIQVRTGSAFGRAQCLLLEMIEHAPTYMAAKVAYAECISAMVSSGYNVERHAICGALELLDEVELHAPETVGLHSQQAHLLDCVWDFRSAFERHRQALCVSLEDSASHHYFGWHLLATGAPEQAVGAFKQARKLAPFFLPSTIMLARASMMAGDMEQALQWANQATNEHPESSHAQIYLLSLRAYINPTAELLRQARDVPLSDLSWSFAAASVAYVLARCGEHEQALQVVERWSQSPSTSQNVSHVTPLLVLGEQERAMRLMEDAAQQNFGSLPIFMRVRENAEITQHPRYGALHQRVFGGG